MPFCDFWVFYVGENSVPNFHHQFIKGIIWDKYSISLILSIPVGVIITAEIFKVLWSHWVWHIVIAAVNMSILSTATMWKPFELTHSFFQHYGKDIHYCWDIIIASHWRPWSSQVLIIRILIIGSEQAYSIVHSLYPILLIICSLTCPFLKCLCKSVLSCVFTL